MDIYTAIVITVSDRSSRGEREDLSGPAAEKMLNNNGFTVKKVEVIPDEQDKIAGMLLHYCQEEPVDLIVTSGGTGFSPRDVTPEATLSVIDRRADGLSELMRAESLKITPQAALSRAVCGICNATLIINLPGSPKGVKENLAAVLPVLEHGIIHLKGGSLH